MPQIFRKASKAIAWLDDIPTWTNLPSALRYLSLRYFSVATRTGVDGHKLASLISDAAVSADNALKLFEHDPSRWAIARDI